MIRILVFIFIVFATSITYSQIVVGMIGNTKPLCLPEMDSIEFKVIQSIDSIDSNDVVMVFSTAYSNITKSERERIIEYMENGGTLFIGCENWPLQSEGNLLTSSILNKEFWGDTKESNMSLSEDQNGVSVVHFPMDSRLSVVSWKGDEPVLLISDHFGGRLILDGGYSKYYCNNSQREDNWKRLMELFKK